MTPGQSQYVIHLLRQDQPHVGDLMELRGLRDAVAEWNPNTSPTIRDYATGSRRGGARTRHLVNFKLLNLLCFLLAGLVLLLLVLPPMRFPFFFILIALAAIAGNLTLRWFIPKFRAFRTSGKFATVGMWLPTSCNAYTEQVDDFFPEASQIVARHVIHGSPNIYCLGLRNGAEVDFRESEDVVALELVDSFEWARRSTSKNSWDGRIVDDLFAVAGWIWDHHVYEGHSDLSLEELQAGLDPYLSPEEIDGSLRCGESAGIIRINRCTNKQVNLTDAGSVWVASIARESGKGELIDEALERTPVHIEVHGNYNHMDGDNNSGNIDMSWNSTGNQQPAPNVTLADIETLVRTLESPENRKTLPEEALPEIDDAVHVLKEVGSEEELGAPRVRQSIRAVTRTAGEIIKGAAGNGFYQLLSTLVS